MKKKNLYRQEKLLDLLAWYSRRMTDYPSLSDLRARGPSHRCTHHEELNECGTESEQKDADPARTKDVQEYYRHQLEAVTKGLHVLLQEFKQLMSLNAYVLPSSSKSKRKRVHLGKLGCSNDGLTASLWPQKQQSEPVISALAVQQEEPEAVEHGLTNQHDELDAMKKALAWQQLELEAVKKALAEQQQEREAVKHLLPDAQRQLESVNNTLLEQQKVLEDVKNALPEQQDDIEDLKLGVFDQHNRIRSINNGLQEQQEKLAVVKNAKEEKTTAIEKRLDELDVLVRYIARVAVPGCRETKSCV